MVQVDLITGFLGAGKTTFLRRYVRYLVEQGHNVCILENDFGAVNVDAMLVQDLLGDRCDLETISGGCDCDTHQRRMRTKLIAMAMRGFDRVVVEPSGIFDVDEFFDVLRDDPLDRWYRIGNVIAIVDAMLPEEYLCVKAGLQIVTPRPAHIFYNDMSNFACFNVSNKLFPSGTLKISSTPTVIGIVLTVRITFLMGIAFEVLFLIDNTVAITSLVIITGQSFI